MQYSEKYLLNNRILTEHGGYLTTLCNSPEFLGKLNPPQIHTLANHSNDNALWNRYELRNFNNKRDNTLLAYSYGKTKADSIISKLYSLLSTFYNTVVPHTTYFYKLLIHTSSCNYHYTGNNTSNYRLLDINDNNAIPSMVNSIRNLIRVSTKYNYSTRIIAFNTITKFYKLIHTHGLVVSDTNNTNQITSIESKWSDYLSNRLNYTVDVSLTPLLIIPHSQSNQVKIDSTNARDVGSYEPVKQWLIYVFKSYKLAYINNQHDLDKWNSLTINQREKYVFGVINTTRKCFPKLIHTTRIQHLVNPLKNEPYQPATINKTVSYSYMRKYIGINTNYTYSFTKAIHKLGKYRATVYRLSYLCFELALYNVVQPVSLLDLSKVDDNSNIDYYRYNNRAKIGGTSKHYGWYDYYTKELTNENRNARDENVDCEQLTIINSRFAIPIKINDMSVRNQFITNHRKLKELPAPALIFTGNRRSVPLTILLGVPFRISNKIENKKLALFNSS